MSNLPYSPCPRFFMAVDGHGDKAAAPLLIQRLWSFLELPAATWDAPIMLAGPNNSRRIQRIAHHTRHRAIDGLLILSDEDDGCPKERAPEMAGWLRAEKLPFPTALVLLHREYETLFLPCISVMAGRPMVDERRVKRAGLPAGLSYPSTDFEGRRGVKEWLSAQLPPGRRYKETVDHRALTAMLDFSVLRSTGLPSFGSLERALRFLNSNRGIGGAVYPG